jgi:hypothetical protein
MVIGLHCHGRQNFKKIGEEIPAPRSPLPAHVLAFPRWKETDMLIHQPTWSQNDISKIVKGRRPVQGV